MVWCALGFVVDLIMLRARVALWSCTRISPLRVGFPAAAAWLPPYLLLARVDRPIGIWLLFPAGRVGDSAGAAGVAGNGSAHAVVWRWVVL